MTSKSSSTGLNGYSYLAIVLFALAIYCVIRPVRILLPRKASRKLVRLATYLRCIDAVPMDARVFLLFNLITAPLLAVLILLITTAIDGSVIRDGIVGTDGGGRPYDVLVLFFALVCLLLNLLLCEAFQSSRQAYIATALDATGVLRYLAFVVSQKGGKNGKVLYISLYSFFFAVATVIGNDPVILSGTAFLAYFTGAIGIAPPTAWTYAQFLAANVASAILVSSNPTNVLITGAFDLNYITGFTKYTALPSLASAGLGLPLLYALFSLRHPPEDRHSVSPPQSPRLAPLDRKGSRRESRVYIPKRIVPPDVEPRSALVDPAGAAFHATLLIVTLITIVGTGFVQGNPPAVWMIAMPAGAVALIRDILVDLLNVRKQATTPAAVRAQPVQGSDGPVVSMMADSGTNGDSAELSIRVESPVYPPTTAQPELVTLPGLWRRLAARFPITAHTVAHLPFGLLPFAIAMFILVASLQSLGWVAVFAHWLAIAAPTPWTAAFVVGPLTAFALCVLAGTNIGATVLMVSVIRHPSYSDQVSKQTLDAAVYSLAMGSNIGAVSWSLSASLAGLLWANILRSKGIIVKQIDFAGWNALPLVLMTSIACAIVVGEVHTF